VTERFWLLITAGMLFIASRATMTIAPQDQPIFRTEIQTVPVYADTRGRLVPDLRETDFAVLDNGRPAALSLFSSSPQPFTVVVMLDTSASMASNLDFLKNAAAEFLNRLQETDRAQVGAFNERVELSGRFTNDREELLDALSAFDVGNPTKLYDGVAASLDALSPITGRKIILVFSDGDDTASRITFDTV